MGARKQRHHLSGIGTALITWWRKLGKANRVVIVGSVLTAIVAGFFMLGAAILPYVWEPSDAELEFEDLTVREHLEIPGDATHPPIRGATLLDFTIRNKGPNAGVLRRVEFRVDGVFALIPFGPPQPITHLFPSFDYPVQLPVAGAPYAKRVDISQLIPARSADRFTVTAEHDYRDNPYLDHVFDMTVTFLYNRGLSTLSRRVVFVATRRSASNYASNYRAEFLSRLSTQTGEELRNTCAQASYNRSLAEQIQRLEGTKTENVLDLIRTVLELQCEPRNQ